ncbi:hypothetical protein GCM10010442_35930 [Kitasatospora kifunensis]
MSDGSPDRGDGCGGARAPAEQGFAHLNNWRGLGKVTHRPEVGDRAGAGRIRSADLFADGLA